MIPSVRLVADTIEGEVLIRATPDRVFDALTSPPELMRWWGSRDTYSIISATVDQREGGSWTIEARDVGGHEFSIDATIVRIERPNLLELHWSTSWSPSEESCVEFRLTPESSGTRLSLRHSGLGGAGTAGRDTHLWAWRSILKWAQSKLATPSGQQIIG